MKPFGIQENQYQKLFQLCRLYRREAKRCMEAKSYLAGCVMIGAAFEAELVAMCHCCSDMIPSELIPRKKNGKEKHLLEWSFFQLLRVARECGWLPSGLSLGEEWDHKKAHVGDYAIVVQQIRNLVHASCYIKDFQRSRLTKRRMELCFKTLDVASDYLMVVVHALLKETVEEREKRCRTKMFNRRPKGQD
jgi:hypothetical protein